MNAMVFAVSLTISAALPPQAVNGGDEQPSNLARAELGIVQTVQGLTLGVFACDYLDCDNARATLGGMVLGAGAGLGFSLWASRDGVTPGQALAVNSATAWGAWQGIAVTMMRDQFDEHDYSLIVGGAQLAGTTSGALMAWQLRPRAGQVAMINSAGIWSGALALLGHGINDFDADRALISASLLAASDLGAIAGAVAGNYFQWSRGRMLVIDAGGLLGMLSGMAADALIRGDGVNSTDICAFGLGGTVVGLVTATYLSRSWDLPDGVPSISLMPTQGGAVATLSGAF